MSIPLVHLKDKSLGVFGLARSGLATVKAAVSGGARVYAWDNREDARAKAAGDGVTLQEPAEWPWEELAALALAPGVPLTHPEPHPIVGMARGAGVEILCDVELLFRELEGKARFVAITGTNGKSTTTALIGHLFGEAGISVEVGGNIGRSALDLAAPSSPEHVYVLELSSYQLDLCHRLRPNVAVWLNLTPDHLDRHGDMAGYRLAKERIFAKMGAGDLAVLGIDETDMEEVALALVERASAPRIARVTVRERDAADIRVDDAGQMTDARSGETLDLSTFPSLRGRHNWQNAVCAYAAVRELGVPVSAITEGMASFPGLEHRMQIVGRRGKVLFVDDSKATNADAAAPALATFQPVYWIVGGRPKAGGINGLSGFFPRVAKAYLIGEAADEFSATLAARVPHVIAGELARAVRMAAEDAALDPESEPVVLLSPAAASFDQFADFEARGRAFVAAVNALDDASAQQAALSETAS
ncbi:UDP-N-acetylmuramoylalanine--D-glutamate ligase [Rhodopseudomonas julia]|uniref:UDP-N-acetylmuramoylalanine--D-glutamate ligase n=1 Tax=Rhodopseudomonas julia TaxID=200617 RepID=A0ABU0C8X9_9BRAD|nr:UDP-N-acetylmuramoyl-L-alanine--D-glutamate ligase [Rhodopseudomonas julia]MDQ0326657.1 UDP-N-acetylmuramoylalanine--D-glutamate ligase [Rhodopseudomonas julia]